MSSVGANWCTYCLRRDCFTTCSHELAYKILGNTNPETVRLVERIKAEGAKDAATWKRWKPEPQW